MGPAATRDRGARGLRDRGRRGDSQHVAARGFDRGRVTLGERIAATWGSLVETGTADCPVCAAELAAGRPCACCGSELT